jgi:hypothetical protein
MSGFRVCHHEGKVDGASRDEGQIVGAFGHEPHTLAGQPERPSEVLRPAPLDGTSCLFVRYIS